MDVPANTYRPEIDNIEKLGIFGFAYKRAIFGCHDIHEVYIKVPVKYGGADFEGGILTIKDSDSVVASIALRVLDTDGTIYEEKPFFGVTFCLDKKYWSASEVSLHYEKGYTQEIFEISDLDKWIKDESP